MSVSAMSDRGDDSGRDDSRAATEERSLHHFFQPPAHLKRLFNKFPLKVYGADNLPLRSPRIQDAHVLHVFTTKEGALKNAPSFNPACLKWQAYLRFGGITFRTVASSNHASPTGVLPFLALASSASPRSSDPIPSNKMQRWVTSQTSTIETGEGMRYEAYTSLVECRIRNAWLFTLYLDERNFEAVAKELYIHPTSSNPLVRMTLQHQLRRAARDELLKTRPYIREDELYREAEMAFVALSTLLGGDAYFFGNEKPTLFDASLFAYTHLLLDESLSWQTTRLVESLRKNGNIAQHRQRLLDRYFDGQKNVH